MIFIKKYFDKNDSPNQINLHKIPLHQIQIHIPPILIIPIQKTIHILPIFKSLHHFPPKRGERVPHGIFFRY